MSATKAVWSNGQVVLEGPGEWPNGRRLIVVEDPEFEQDDSCDPDAIGRWIAEVDAIPPLQMTEDEEHAWQDSRRVSREQEASQLVQHADELRRLFE